MHANDSTATGAPTNGGPIYIVTMPSMIFGNDIRDGSPQLNGLQYVFELATMADHPKIIEVSCEGPSLIIKTDLKRVAEKIASATIKTLSSEHADPKLMQQITITMEATNATL